MEPIPTDQHELVIELLRANQDLLRQNNELLQKQERRERRRLVFKVIWYTILLGIPMVAYYFLYSTFVGLTGGGAGVETSGIAVPPGVLEELLKVYTGQ
jgi:hypothetical protein